MSLDAATLALVAGELKNTLLDAKIDKIFEPTRDEVLMTLRTRTETHRLLLSARSGSARVCLTKESFENPLTPPGFCMLLRKHLTGGRLIELRREPGDRIVYFDFRCTNEMGDLVTNTLAVELMGRYSNLVLVQGGRIIDALKRVDFDDSEVRQLLPGLAYTLPPKPARPDFLETSAAAIVAAACEKDLPVAQALGKTVAGVGPVVVREAVCRALGETPALACDLNAGEKAGLAAAIDELKDEHAHGGTPTAVRLPQPDGAPKPVEFSFFVPQQYGGAAILTRYPSYSEMLEDYYATKDRAERLRQKSRELYKAVHNMYDRAVRKQAARKEELSQSAKADTLRDCLLAAGRYGLAGLPLRYKLKLAWCMVRYKMCFADGVALYGKYVGNWGGAATRWRFDAKNGDTVVKSVTLCPSHRLHLEVTPSATVLQEGDTYDMAGVRVRILDENGSPAVYAQLPLTFAVTGAAALVGPAAATAEGGMGGTYLRTVGQTGTAALTVSAPQCAPVTVEFTVTKKECAVWN